MEIDRPSLHVLATTPDATRLAIASARRVARRLGASLVLLVPKVTSEDTPLEGMAAEASLAAQFEPLVASLLPDIAVLVCVCRTPDDIFERILDGNAITFVGGRASSWWPSPEQRMTRRLAARGYQIVFVDCHQPDGFAVTSDTYSDTNR